MLTFDNMRLEQRRVGEFLQLGLLLKECTAPVPSESLQDVAAGTVYALSHFIESELNYRQSERYQVLNIQQARIKALDTLGAQANRRGVQVLKHVEQAFQPLRSDLGNLKVAGIDAELEEHRETLLATLAESELKARDVQRLADVVADFYDAINSNGVLGVIEKMEDGLKQLDSVRQQPDRGVIDNFPLWKLGGLIIILGVGIIALIHCGIFGCSISTRNAYIAALITTALITLGC